MVNGNQRVAMAHVVFGQRAKKTQEAQSGDLEDMWIEVVLFRQLLQAARAGDLPIMSHALAILLAEPMLE